MTNLQRLRVTYAAALNISVLSAAHVQRGGDILRDARFFCNNNISFLLIFLSFYGII
jgi:hypothetical protein